MDDAELKARLETIAARLAAVEARLLPEGDAQRLAEDALETRGVMGQVAEVLSALRDVLHDAPEQLRELRQALAAHDAKLKEHDEASADERSEIRELMVQLRENSRKQVAGLADLERAVYGGRSAQRRRVVGDEERG